ncbi:MAG: HAD hydrolase-like protein [Nitrospirae bacterium]|nr:HAD hydrolase-like protein [Nitrospirota bacterium]
MIPAANRPIFPALRWISFDCYGTLIDWESGIREALAGAMRKRRLRADAGRLFRRWEKIQYDLLDPYRSYREVLKESFRRLLREKGMAVTPRESLALVKGLRDWRPFEDVRPSLEKLRERYLLAVVSNMDRDLLERTLGSIGVFFNAVVAAQDVRAYKPSDRPFLRLLEVAAARPEEVLHCAFGVKYDLGVAHRLGLRTALIQRGPVGRVRPAPDFVFRNLRELADLLPRQHRP